MFLELRHKKTLSFSQDYQAASVKPKAHIVKLYSTVCAEHQKVSKTQTENAIVSLTNYLSTWI